MQLPNTTQSYPKLFDIIPRISQKYALAIYPYIFLPTHIYHDLTTKNPQKQHLAILLHEQIHLKRQKNFGVIKWLCLYLINPTFRLQEELAAIKVQQHYLKKHHLSLNLPQLAQHLAGLPYLWCTSYNHALKTLKKLS